MGWFNKFRGDPTSRVEMVVSVDQYVAGLPYDVPVEVADRLIVRGYATGQVSREFAPEELHALSVNSQTVGL